MRKISFFFFLFFSVMSFTFSSFAGVASGSNAMRVPLASWSNASKAWDDFKDGFDRINDVDDVAMFVSDSISYNGLAYRSDGGTWSFTTTVGGVVDLPSLGGDVYYTGFYLQLGKPDLPSYGKYNFSFSLFDVLQNVRSSGVDNVSADYFILADEQKNVSASFVNSDPVTVNKSSNAWTAYGTLSISGKTSVVGYRMNFYNDVKLRSIKFKLLDVSVTYAGSNSTVLATSPSSNNQDTVGAVADAANALVDKQDTIIDQIVNTTQTISNQLYSFWNQLAGEFTNLYNKMNQHHSEDLAKVDEQISADRQNTADLITNQDKNTDQITHGFDSSGMNSANDKLKGQLSDYDSKEKEVLGQVNEKVDSFEFEEPLSASHFVGPLEDIRYFLTGVYNGYSSLNIPIGFSLTLTIALIVIGYYRFKGGS